MFSALTSAVESATGVDVDGDGKGGRPVGQAIRQAAQRVRPPPRSRAAQRARPPRRAPKKTVVRRRTVARVVKRGQRGKKGVGRRIGVVRRGPTTVRASKPRVSSPFGNVGASLLAAAQSRDVSGLTSLLGGPTQNSLNAAAAGGGGSGAKTTSMAELTADRQTAELSSLTGRRRALFIGINYTRCKTGVLKGCINDVENVREMITTKFKFTTSPDNMRVLTDAPSTPAHSQPTKRNILAGFKWLIEGAKRGDSLFLHYSGHGGTQKDVAPDTDEIDRQDETLCPVDYQTAGVIVDDDLWRALVQPLPKGCRLTCITDCCHSSSILDLPFTYKTTGELEDISIVEVDHIADAKQAALAAGMSLITGDKAAAISHGLSAAKSMMSAYVSGAGAGAGAGGDANAAKRQLVVRETHADVIHFSGCLDAQTSADARIGGEATGAMSWALIKALNEHGDHQTYTELLKNLRKNLAGRFKQIPQLSTGDKLNLNVKFDM